MDDHRCGDRRENLYKQSLQCTDLERNTLNDVYFLIYRNFLSLIYIFEVKVYQRIRF